MLQCPNHQFRRSYLPPDASAYAHEATRLQGIDWENVTLSVEEGMSLDTRRRTISAARSYWDNDKS